MDPDRQKTHAANAFWLRASETKLRAAAGRPPQISILAYSGGIMSVEGFGPLVIDLAGLELPDQVTLLSAHQNDPAGVIGVGQPGVVDGELHVDGELLAAGGEADRIVMLHKSGVALTASVGVEPLEKLFIEPGQTIVANGRQHTAGQDGLTFITRGRLREVSVLPAGADADTSVSIAAQAMRGTLMNNDANTDPNNAPQETNDKPPIVAPPLPVQAAAVQPTGVEELRAQASLLPAEETRIIEIKRLCAGSHPAIEAKAIGEGWDNNRCQVEVMRDRRPKGPAIHSHDSTNSAETIEAALCLTAGIPEDQVAAQFSEQTMDAATRPNMRGWSIHETLHAVVQAAGGYVRPGKVNSEVIQEAFRCNDKMIQASTSGFSTVSLTNILGNAAHKKLLSAFRAVNVTWPSFCAIESNSDFKQHTRFRLIGEGEFELVGSSGELKHISLSDQQFTSQLDTFGAILSLTRQQIINDDLDAFLQLPKILGRMSALKMEKSAYTLLLINTGSFFHADNGNLLTGAGSALDIAGLTAAENEFLKQTDSSGDPLMVEPRVLLVPTTLKVTADSLNREVTVVALQDSTSTASSKLTADNPHAGKFIPTASPWLNNQGLTGSSDTAWYLVADPADVAPVEMAFLDGEQNPTIESGETNFNTLGIQWRAFHDFGVAFRDHQAAVKSTGG